jgi:transposase
LRGSHAGGVSGGALEDANIKLDSVITDIMGLSGRKIIEALIAGETDPAKLARLADPRVKASQQTLRQALRGRVTGHHLFLLRLHLDQIDALDVAIAKIDQEVEAGIAPFRTAVEQVSSTPGVKTLAAMQFLSEIGTDMGRFGSDANLVSWACICPRSDESAGKRRSTRIRKGSPWFKTTLVQCAWAAVRRRNDVPRPRPQPLRCPQQGTAEVPPRQTTGRPRVCCGARTSSQLEWRPWRG